MIQFADAIFHQRQIHFANFEWSFFCALDFGEKLTKPIFLYAI
jgi:hypothetical protein